MREFAFFDKLSLNKFYKYILYLAGIIYTLSLFFDTKGITQIEVQKIALNSIVLGIILWLSDDIFQITFTYLSHILPKRM